MRLWRDLLISSKNWKNVWNLETHFWRLKKSETLVEELRSASLLPISLLFVLSICRLKREILVQKDSCKETEKCNRLKLLSTESFL
jgi:hypothetical protein